MIWTQKTSTLFSLLVPLMAISVPLLDVGVAIVRRILSHQPIFKADRAHIHHRLLDRGLTSQNAVLVLYVFAGLAAGLALLLTSPQGKPFRNLLLALLMVGILLGLRELRYKEFRYFGQMLLGGDMRQALLARLRLEQWEVQLRAARTPQEWWKTLQDADAQFGWVRLYWVGPLGIQEQVFFQEEPGWTFFLSLGAMGSLQIDGRKNEGSFTMADLSAAIQRSVMELQMDAAPSETTKP